MTRPHDEQAPLGADRIRAELLALGEDPADDDELAFASSAAALAPDDVRTVVTLVELSSWAPPSEGLLPLERHRVWQRIASRVPPASTGGQAHGAVPPSGGHVVALPTSVDGHPHAPAANGGGAVTHGFRGVLASLALVAGVALMLNVEVPRPPTVEHMAEIEERGQILREAVAGLGEQDGARARSLADGYAERLSAARGAER